MFEKNLAIVLISITVVVLAWVGFSVYHSIVTSTLDSQITVQIQPIRRDFNPLVMQRLRERASSQPTYELDTSTLETKPDQASSSGQLETTTITPTPQIIDVTPEPTGEESL